MKNFVAAGLMVLGMVGAASAAPDGLDDYRWHKRLVVVFARSPGDARLADQRRALATLTRAPDDRDLMLIEVVGDRVTPGRLDGAGLRRRFNVGPGGFRALLIGKDGGVKLDQPNVIPAARLSAVIDAMPMRRDEMGRR